jgi:hypothetical protein
MAPSVTGTYTERFSTPELARKSLRVKGFFW